MSAQPSADALWAAAAHQATSIALAAVASTGIRKGVYRFASPRAAQEQADSALANVMAECAGSLRRRS
ncbi:MAG: hypothetical protein JNL30_17640 [Rubrivivax sp.]|nr:hypothetical protein [Rubrivivax sp.]